MKSFMQTTTAAGILSTRKAAPIVSRANFWLIVARHIYYKQPIRAFADVHLDPRGARLTQFTFPTKRCSSFGNKKNPILYTTKAS
jgi:hypothetical protein